MQRIDGSYLYRLGHQLHSLTEWRPTHSDPPPVYNDIFLQVWFAIDPLEGFLNQSVFRPKYCRGAGIKLYNHLVDLKAKMLEGEFDLMQAIDHLDHWNVTSAAREFETVFTTEFNQMPLYVVAKKGAYDTADLIENGSALFPAALHHKVPDSVGDVAQAARCLAFELPTAAGFHIHRANESVLKKYFAVVAPNEPPPNTRNMGDYLKILEQKNSGMRMCALR